MTDYSLWEVILNCDSPTPTRVIEGVVYSVAPTTAEQRLARKNELKARGTLLIALPDKHQLKFNIRKDAKTLMEAIEKSFGGNKETKKVQKTLLKQQYENFTGSSYESLDQIHDRLQKLISQLKILRESLYQEDINLKFLRSLPTEWRTHTLIWRNNTDLEEQSLDDFFNSLKIYEDEVKSSFSASTFTQNIAFVSSQTTDSTNESVSDVASVSATSLKIPVSALPNVDTLNADDLEEMDLKWQMAMLTVRARRFLQRTGKNLGANGPTLIGFDMSKVECYNCHRKGHFTRECRSPKDTRRNVQEEEEPTNYAIMTFTSSSSDNEVFTSSMFDCDEMFSSETDESLPASPLYDRYQSGEGYHVVPSLYTGTFMPPKPDLVFHNAPNDRVSDSEDDSETQISENAPNFVPPTEQVKTPRPFVKPVETSIPAANHKTAIPKPTTHGNSKNRKACFVCKSLSYLIKNCDYYENKMAQTSDKNYAQRGHNQHYARKSLIHPQRHVVPTAILTKSRPIPLTAARPVTVVVPKPQVTKPRPMKNGNPQHALKDKGVIDSGCSRHMTWNMSYLSDFKAINRGYVAFGGNPKGDSLLPILFWAEAVNTACYVQNRVLVTTPHNKTLYELLHGRTPSIGFMRLFGCPVTILNTLDSLGKFNRKVDEGFLVGYAVSSSGPIWLFDIDTLTKTMNYQPVTASNQSNPSTCNTDDDAEFEVEKPESEVHVSLSSSAKTKKHNDKTRREAKGKRPIELSSGVRKLIEEFEDFSDNNTNEVNVVSTPVPAVGQNTTNNTNTFSVVGPFNTDASPTHGESSYVDPFQYPDDPDMPALEDITYSDDEEDVGAKADFTNLETTITVNPIPTTRVHRDHPVSQIIGDLSFGPLTRSMTRMVTDEGTKWVFRNKKDERGIVVRNKARLVAQGHTQEEGINYEEVFAPVVRIEAIRLFLSYASIMDFMVYQMDVKSAFLYGTIKQEVYVCQPTGFEEHDYPDKVYKVVKAFHRLHQAPRAWYETLANYLLENGFQKGKIDQILYIKRQKGDILLVQIYVDDIIFGSTNKDLCKAFEKLIKDKFQMSSMGELTLFLGLQVKQKLDGIFISQDKYVAEILRKFGLTDGKSTSTPIDTESLYLRIQMVRMWMCSHTDQ
uniref:Retrovirus-related Pol polyprotein from transposon TNT 1-94 n=1 Tax=Tanacetum cinerariifolium TaxID=118510 RepID=A0A6L2LYP8_TANCI|nr:retrovirus-related Pol polyprotein from transposon TNT 1-94 [Tanacetum cinerariifolium]